MKNLLPRQCMMKSDSKGAGRATPQPAAAPKTRRRRLKRRAMAAIGGLTMCLVAPASLVQILLYRQNLVVAREGLPPAPTFTAHDRLLVLAPHCDDETLGVGGTLATARARGASVRVVFLTNGDASVSTQIAEDTRQLRRSSFQGLARMRQQETLRAMRTLGISSSDVIFLGYPDGGTKTMWEVNWSPDNPYRSPYTDASRSPYANSRTPSAVYAGQQALRDVREVMEEWRPTVIFTTHPADTHPDHWAAYAYANAALQALRLEPRSRGWASRVHILTFLVHRGVWPAPHGYHPDAALSPPASLKDNGTQWMQVPLDQHALEAKKAALNCYASQLAFTPHYLRSFLRRNELLGVLSETVVPTPKTPAEKHLEKDLPQILVQDPERDSLLHEVWPAADLKAIALVEPSANDSLTLRVRLAKPLARRVRYQLALHIVNGPSEMEASLRPSRATSSVWTVQVQQRGSTVQATMTDSETGEEVSSSAPQNGNVALTARRVDNGFEVQMPRERLQLGETSALLVSASTHRGRQTLDQTEIGTLRLLPLPTSAALAVRKNTH